MEKRFYNLISSPIGGAAAWLLSGYFSFGIALAVALVLGNMISDHHHKPLHLKTHWFKAKPFGWGWYPATWEGWLVLGLYAGAIAWCFYRVDAGSRPGSDTLVSFAPVFILLTAALLLICYTTGEKPRWRWGWK